MGIGGLSMFFPMILFADCDCDGGCDCTTCFTMVPISYTVKDYNETCEMIENCQNEMSGLRFRDFKKRKNNLKKLSMLMDRKQSIINYLGGASY